MSQDKELEIQMQFLEEANDYLDTLEAVLLELGSNNRINPDRINAALRAAHSIKGGAGMVGFRDLSDLAHRLEDSLKVLKTSKNLQIDQDLQGLLLSGVDWLRKVAQLNAQRQPIDQQWLEKYCYPIFTELHQHLGDPTPEDATSMLSPEDDGQNIIPLIFQTEVEGCLQRLEAVLATNDMPCLKEEVAIMAAELAGLGEMLELKAFSSLCESVTQQLEATPHRVVEIARASLEAWRRSQALVLINQVDCLPSLLELPATATPTVAPQEDTETLAFAQENHSQWQTEEIAEIAAVGQTEARLDVTPDMTEETWLDEIITADFERLATMGMEMETDNGSVDLPPLEAVVADDEPTTEIQFVTPPLTAETPASTSERVGASRNEVPTETTVRVSIKHLQQINDFFGELTIQRNGLNLQVERLRKLIRSLSQRVKTLDRENRELRSAYDKVATAGINQMAVTNGAPLLGYGEAGIELPIPNEATLLDKDTQVAPQFDALEMDRYNEMHLLSQDVMETIVQVQEVTSDIELSLEDTDQ
ncbi:MAG: Hpt domain-containing protein, partial [Nostocaceae cyanobacterium]|nr:Hpt domain-containing protein [Nostocaceae cyanobacterium]